MQEVVKHPYFCVYMELDTQRCPLLVLLSKSNNSRCVLPLISDLVCIIFWLHIDGLSRIQDYEMNAQQLVDDTIIVVEYLIKKFQDPTIVIVGHSMGGAIAIKTTEQLLKSDYADKIQGLIVIDVVEGSAIDALPFME